MENLFDEFSKSLAESVPRRESLRRLGAVFAGAVLSPLGVGTAWAGRRDPCQAFCKCRTTKQQSQCLAACRACNGNTGRIGGSCGKYVCCSTAACGGVCSDLLHDPNCGACGNNCHALGETCCGGHCADLATDVSNCGSCGAVCAAPPPNESVACVSGTCVSDCVAGAVRCNGTCTPVDRIPTTAEPAAASVADQHRIVTTGNAAHALRAVRFAVAFAPTWTLTTPTAERAASFALTGIAAREYAHRYSRGYSHTGVCSNTYLPELRDRSWTICSMNSPSHWPSRCRAASRCAAWGPCSPARCWARWRRVSPGPAAGTRARLSASVARRSSSRSAWRPAGRATATPAASADRAGDTSAARPPLAAGCAATCCTTRTAGPAEITATPWERPVAAVIAPISPPTSPTAEAAGGVCRTSSQRNRRVHLRHVRLQLRRRRRPLQRHLHTWVGSGQLRSLRQRLWRINAVLYRRDLHGIATATAPT